VTELEKIISKLPISEHSKSLIPDYINFIQAPVGLKALAGVSEVYLELVNLGGFQDFPYAQASKFSSLAKEIVDSEQKLQTTLPELATNRQKK